MPIAKLPPHVINLIAAGEVVERPASVAKELVENAVDSGASLVQVLVEGGGMEAVRVIDDGCGIPADEVHLALERHATSKLRRAEDLATVATLGFRGEALAAIGSVSRLTLTSRTAQAQGGVRVRLDGGELSPPEPAAHPVGTTVEVRSLFFNAPVRQRFLRTPPTEYRRIADVVQAAALASHAVGFELSHDGRRGLHVPAGQSRQERAAGVLGGDVAGAFILVRDETPDGSLEAWIGPPHLTRSNADGLRLVVNGRPVTDRLLLHAVREAYRDLIPAGRYPVALLYLDLPPRSVDVNVHPAKAEVRLLDPRRVHSLVRARLRERVMAPGFRPAPPGAQGEGAAREAAAEDIAEDAATQERVREAIAGYLAERRGQDARDPHRRDLHRTDARSPSRPAPLFRGPVTAAPASAGLFADQATPVRYLQVAATYLVAEDAGGLLVVDQHALHERVLYERFLAAARAGAPPRQRLLLPLPVDVGPAAAERLEEVSALLDDLGLEITRAGEGTVLVSALPPALAARSDAFVQGLVHDLLAEAADPGAREAGASDRPAVLDRLVKTMACRAAVKAGDPLGPELVAELLASREHVEGTTACPHGRPTSVRIGRDDLERWFLRR